MTATVRRRELDGELTIVTAAETGELLKSLVTKGTDLQLGLSGVTDFDAAGLQLLLSARATAEQLGTTLKFVDPSPPVTSVLALARIEDELLS